MYEHAVLTLPAAMLKPFPASYSFPLSLHPNSTILTIVAVISKFLLLTSGYEFRCSILPLLS
jgi:hypothetical protein